MHYFRLTSLLSLLLISGFAFSEGAVPAAAQEAALSAAEQHGLDGAAGGRRILPPFRISAGGGTGFFANFWNFNYTDAKKTSGYFTDFTGYTLGLPVFGFVDAVYAVFETGPVFARGEWERERPGIESYIAYDFVLMAKFPVLLDKRLTIFPLAGARFRLGLTDKLENTGTIDSENLTSFWVLAGAGLDVSLTRRFYFRLEALYANKTGSGYGKMFDESGYYSSVTEQGAEVHLAFGARLGKLKNLSEIDNVRVITVHEGAAVSKEQDFSIEFVGYSGTELAFEETAEKVFGEIAAAYKQNPALSIVIEGRAHAVLNTEDEVPTLNKLARLRAYYAATRLHDDYGIPLNKMTIFILGGDKTKVEGDNRRVDIKLVSGAADIMPGVYQLQNSRVEVER